MANTSTPNVVILTPAALAVTLLMLLAMRYGAFSNKFEASVPSFPTKFSMIYCSGPNLSFAVSFFFFLAKYLPQVFDRLIFE